jgi:hypothetical protein
LRLFFAAIQKSLYILLRQYRGAKIAGKWRVMITRLGHHKLKNAFCQFFLRVIKNEDVQSIIYKNLKRPIDVKAHLNLNKSQYSNVPYTDIAKSRQTFYASKRSDIIFITARFRSGSTLLWNLFRNIEGVTSYYEPFNERRWFDKSTRGDKIDATHKGVSDYWTEYSDLEILQQYYQIEWIDQNLLMDSSFWAPEMKRFVEIMIEKAPGRPVLQFNRIDFRLPWFRYYFPNAKMIHLYRHPRDQWCSSLMKSELFPKTARMEDFAPYDEFYLGRWGRDLQYHFPFLDQASIAHPYQLFYYIWKLSYLFGTKYSHHSLAYEDLLTNTEKSLEALLNVVEIKPHNIDRLKNLIVAPPLGKWKLYAEDEWFSHHENVCESVLSDFLRDMT